MWWGQWQSKRKTKRKNNRGKIFALDEPLADWEKIRPEVLWDRAWHLSTE